MADSEGYCEGDACPGGAAVVGLPPPDCSSLQYVILVTTGVTCIALLLDLAKRYLFTKRTQDKSTLTESKQGTGTIEGDYVDGGFKLGFEGNLSGKPPSYSETAGQDVMSSNTNGYQGNARYRGGFGDAETIVPSTGRPLQAQTILEGDEAGDTDQQGQSSGQQQQQLGRELGLMLDDLMTALRTSVHSDIQTQDMPESYKENVAKLTGLEHLFMSLSREVDDRTLDVVSAPSDGETEAQSLETLSRIEKESAAYKKCWLGMRRLLYCVDIHIRNSTHYQLFHYECDRLQGVIDKYSAQIQSDAKGKDASSMSNEELVASVKELEKVNNLLKMWGDTIARLCEQSKNVYPVHQRTEELQDPVAARALCGYHTDKSTVKEGDVMLLLDNSDSEKWKLSNTAGEALELPAAVCVIPPPDLNTMKVVARVESSFKELNASVQEKNSRSLNLFAERLGKLIASKDFKSISKEQRDELLGQMTFLEVFLRKFDQDGQNRQTFDKFAELRTKVSNLEENGSDSAMSELLQLFTSWQSIATMYESSAYESEKRKLLVKQGIILDAEETEWEALAEIEEARRELGLAVSIHRETMAVGEATKYETATGETRQTFSITGVIDPRNDAELSMDEAIEKGLIDQTKGIYKNLKTGDECPIPVAMSMGLIKVSATKTTKARELKKAIGVITVEFTRETRPFKITQAVDPVAQKQIPIAEAVDRGMFDPERETYKNIDTGEEMSVENAIDSSLLVVEYDTEADATEPEVTKKTFTISSALDRKSGKHYMFDEAVDRGLLDKDAGMFLDTISGQKINIVEAIKRKWMKGRVVTDPDKIDATLMSRGRSGSVDSQASESSKGEFE